jgi:hypothetical protein
MPRVGFEPMVPVLELEKTLHTLDRAVTVTSCIQIKFVNVADSSRANPLYPPSFLIIVIDGFGKARVYRREHCAWNLSGRSVGQGITWTRTMWIEASVYSSILNWYTRKQFTRIKLTGIPTYNNMTILQLPHCYVHFLVNVIAYHTWLSCIQNTSGGRRITTARRRFTGIISKSRAEEELGLEVVTEKEVELELPSPLREPI